MQNAHSSSILCLCHLVSTTYATGGEDHSLKIWSTLDYKLLGYLEEDAPITHMVRLGKTSSGDITMCYVSG